MIKLALIISMAIISFISLKLCCPKNDDFKELSFNIMDSKAFYKSSTLYLIKPKKDITVDNYFQFLDSIVKKYAIWLIESNKTSVNKIVNDYSYLLLCKIWNHYEIPVLKM